MNTDAFFAQFLQEETTRTQTRKKNQSTRPAEFLSLKVGGVYTLALLPTLMVEYDDVSFKSRLDGSYQYLGLSPQSVSLGANILKKDDPISKRLWKAWNSVKNADKAAQSEALQLVAKTKRLANVYVISDSLDPENNGQNKVLQFGAGFNKKTEQPLGNIWKVIHKATQGSAKEDYGIRMFDLGPDGISLRITVNTKQVGKEKISEYEVDCVPRRKADALTQEQIATTLSKAFDLKPFVPELRSFSELEQVLREHWDCDMDADASVLDTIETAVEKSSASPHDDDDFDFGTNP